MASKKGNAGNATPRVVQFPKQDDQQNSQGHQTAPIMFGALLKERRKKAQLSQKDFADMMHVTRNTVINWEADKSKPDYNLIPELCTLLNIQIHELFHMQAQTALSDLEDRVVNNLRQLTPTSRKVVDKIGCLTVFIIRTFQKAYKGFIFLSNIKFIFARYLLLLYNNSVHD